MKKLLLAFVTVAGFAMTAEAGPVKMVAQVPVGCKGRVETVTVENFTLAYSDSYWLTFRASKNMAHKCGDTRWIAADGEIVLPRNQAHVGPGGILYSPAVNASVRCGARSGWYNGTANCVSAYLTQ